jgi:hypothetical protein
MAGAHSGAVAHLVEALRYKPEGRGFDSRWSHWNFSLTILPPSYGPGVDTASNRIEYQRYVMGDKGGWCTGLTTLPLPYADFLEVCEPEAPAALQAEKEQEEQFIPPPTCSDFMDLCV